MHRLLDEDARDTRRGRCPLNVGKDYESLLIGWLNGILMKQNMQQQLVTWVDIIQVNFSILWKDDWRLSNSFSGNRWEAVTAIVQQRMSSVIFASNSLIAIKQSEEYYTS